MPRVQVPETVEGSADARLEAATPAPSGPRPTRFRAGEMVANRYRVLRFIDRGGMGEVYEVLDCDLDVKVALKCVLLAHDPGGRTLARLRKELLLARKVTHPNVCRLFDLGFHVEGAQAIAFLTMDLLEGETLSARLAREGRMTVAEARPIALGIIAGLEAVHAAGIIHRDLKTSNVMLVDGTRAVLTDFGVALSARDEAAEGEPPLVGSPLYMSPEQVTGERLTPASDVYALGVVLFEMVTGTLPFTAETGAAAARMRLREPAPAPRTREPSLDPRWDRAIKKCLAREPSERFGTPDAVAHALASQPALQRIGALALVGLATLAVLRVAGATAPRPDAPSAAIQAPHKVAVLPLQNAVGRPDVAWISTALGEMLATELASGPELRLVPGEVTARALRDMDAREIAAPSGEELAHVRAVTDADLVIAGAYWAEPGGALRVEITLVEPEGARTIAKLAGAGSATQPFDLALRTAADVRKKLGLRAPPAAEIEAARATMPTGEDAARLYAEGLALERADDLVGARERFTSAVEADPAFPLAHSELADVQRLLGYGSRAREEAQKALALSRKLPRESQLLLEGRNYAASNQWAKAAEAYGALFRFFPDDLDHGLRYARASLNAGRPDEAFAILGSLRKLPRPASDNPRIDLFEATVATKASDYRRALARANDAIAKADASGAKWILADALELASEAEWRLGNRARALDAGERARDLYAELGNKRGLAVQLETLASIYVDGADFARASALQEEALGIARAIQHEYRVAGLLNRIGIVRHLQGDFVSARRYYEESRAVYRTINDREGIGHTTTNMGFSWLEEGDLAKARPLLEEGLAVFGPIGAKMGEKNARLGLALVAHAAGDLEKARRGLEEVVRASEELSDPEGAAEARLALARVERDMGQTTAAKADADRALAAYRAIEHPNEELDAQLLLGAIALDEGDAATAQRLAHATFAAADLRGLLTRRAPALALELRARLQASGASPATADLAQRAADLTASDARAIVRAEVTIALAAQDARAGAPDSAAASLRHLITRADAAGLVVQSFDARLALVEWVPQERARAADLAAAARAKGLARVARRAAALAAR